MNKQLKIFLFLTLLCTILLTITGRSQAQNISDKKVYLKTIDYKLDFKIDYKNEKLSGICSITLLNNNDQTVDKIPLLLYRLMKIKSIKDEKGKEIPFTQQVLSYDDWEVYQVNYIEASLANPLAQNDKKTITIEYEGYLLGYTETGMRYVQDNISPEFTIIRPDCKAYPEIGYPSWASNRSAGYQSFNYTVKVTVPDSLIVANGGRLINKTVSNGNVTFVYQNIKPAWRIDVAVAKYNIIENGKIKIFYFPKDSSGAEMINKATSETMELFTKWWGPLQDYQGYSIIEIPDGWGSQTDVTCIIQSAAAFKKVKQHRELYHEISHLWNSIKKNDEFPCRWDEGLATFTEYLTVEKLEKREVLSDATERIYKSLQEIYKKNPEYSSIPMNDFGKEGVTTLSYKVGMILFQVLYNIEGEENYNKMIGSFIKKYYQSGATTLEFINHCKNNSEVNLTKFFDDWMFTSKYTDYIIDNIFPIDIAQKYK